MSANLVFIPSYHVCLQWSLTQETVKVAINTSPSKEDRQAAFLDHAQGRDSNQDHWLRTNAPPSEELSDDTVNPKVHHC